MNHLTGETLPLVHSDGFALYRGEFDPDVPKQSIRLGDFALTDFRRAERTVRFDLESHRHQIACRWQWELSPDGPYARSQLEVKNIGAEPLEIPDADVLVLRLASSSGTPDQTRFLSGGPGRLATAMAWRSWLASRSSRCWKPYFTTIAWA